MVPFLPRQKKPEQTSRVSRAKVPLLNYLRDVLGNEEMILVGLADACYPVCYCVVNCSFLSISDVGPSSRNEALFIYIYTVEFVYDC